MIKKAHILQLFLISIFAVSCASPQPDATDIRSLAKEFLVALSRYDMASARARSTDGFLAGIGGESALAEFMDRYAAYLVPNLFEFESPQPEGNAYRTRAYLHDGKRNMQPLDIWVVASDSGWKVDRLEWHQLVRER